LVLVFSLDEAPLKWAIGGFVEMPKIIRTEIEKCIGCRLCEMHCAIAHEGDNQSRIRIESFFPGIEIPVLCFHCKNTPCKNACPVEAIRIEENCVVQIDSNKCIGCGECVRACPAKAIFKIKKQMAPVVCDLCKAKTKLACVDICPTKALIYDEVPFDGSLYAKDPEIKAMEYCKKNNLHNNPDA